MLIVIGAENVFERIQYPLLTKSMKNLVIIHQSQYSISYLWETHTLYCSKCFLKRKNFFQNQEEDKDVYCFLCRQNTRNCREKAIQQEDDRLVCKETRQAPLKCKQNTKTNTLQTNPAKEESDLQSENYGTLQKKSEEDTRICTICCDVPLIMLE